MIDLQFAPFFEPLYLVSVFLMTVGLRSRYQFENAASIISKWCDDKWMIKYSVVFVVIIGLRPITAQYFGDTGNYGGIFESMKGSIPPVIGESEWFFYFLMYVFANYIGNFNVFLTVIAFIYQFSTLWACKKLLPNNYATAMVFCMGAFSFYTYCTNGIRNGLACSLLLLAFSYMVEEKGASFIKAGVLSLIAYNIHHSTALPIACMITAYYYKNINVIYVFWVISIAISLVFGNVMIDFFTNLGFDDRMKSYTDISKYAGEGYDFGFRWDFLLYSVMPIWLGYYIIYKRQIYDRKYTFLLGTYMLANAFWIMVIRSTFSNRFAYLSWFMYPIVIAYPLLKLDVYGDKQGKMVTRILLAHTLFTIFMNVVYYQLLHLGH